MEVCNVTSVIINTESDRNIDVYNNIHNDSDNYRTSYDRFDSSQDTRLDDSINENINQRNDNINVNIYRYKFTEDFTGELFKFSKIHQYDERKAFKEAWNIWMDENQYIVNEEYRRLKELGYDGDISDKMFKSARYYFRKKSTEKKAPAKRRIYVGTQKDLLEAMDEHIKSNISYGDFKPSDGFDEFCKQNVNLLKEEITELRRAGLTDPNEIKSKIKKTYKNRYFLAINK
jgi:hypothetical protein